MRFVSIQHAIDFLYSMEAAEHQETIVEFPQQQGKSALTATELGHEVDRLNAEKRIRNTPATDRICCECRFARSVPFLGSCYICQHPTSTRQPPTNLVTGKVYDPEQVDCGTARTTILPDRPESCGPTGRYWEPREPA